MPRRWFEVESDPPEETWRRIRALRADPPRRLEGNRHRLFVNSLEQAQQQFDAAALVGFESRALNLYYGLAQAGRAIAVARGANGESAAMHGHGLKVLNTDSVDGDNFAETLLRGDGGEKTSFAVLARILGSDPIREPTTIGAIWQLIPEIALDYPITDAAFPPPLWLNGPYGDNGIDPNGRKFMFQTDVASLRDDASSLRAVYPDLEGAKLLSFGLDGYDEDMDDGRSDQATFLLTEGAVVRRLRGDFVLMPSVSRSRQSLDPLLAWWSLLFSLSIVTRYHPVEWTRLIDINRSDKAVAIEAALSKAMEGVPIQIYLALTGG